MTRGYFAEEKDGDYGFPIVATSAREAKGIAATITDLDCDYVDIRVRWVRDARVDGLPIGHLEDLKEALRREFFGYLEDGICERCGKEDYVELWDEKIICRDCRDAKIS